MKLPRDLSGANLIALLTREYGYYHVHQVGSDSSNGHTRAPPDRHPGSQNIAPWNSKLDPSGYRKS